MLEEKDYCDEETSWDLYTLGLDKCDYYDGPIVLLYEAQKWLMDEMDIYIYPTIDRFIDEDGNTLWVTHMYIPYVGLRILEKRKTYQEALLDGIKEAIKFINEMSKNKNEIKEHLLDFLTKRLGVTAAEICDSKPRDFMDSLDTIEMVMEIERTYGFDINNDWELWDDSTLDDIVQYVSDKLEKQ